MTAATYVAILNGLTEAHTAVTGSGLSWPEMVPILDGIDAAILATHTARSRCSDNAPAREVAS